MNSGLLLSPSLGRTRAGLILLGVVILLGGLGSSVSIWRAQDRIERQASARQMNDPGSVNIIQPLSPDDSRRYTRDVELYYGKTGVLLDKWTRWLEKMTQGKPLARTIAVASLLLASGLFYFATVHLGGQRG